MREGYVIGWANNDVMYCACVLGVCPFSSVKYFGDSCVVNGCSSGVYNSIPHDRNVCKARQVYQSLQDESAGYLRVSVRRLTDRAI